MMLKMYFYSMTLPLVAFGDYRSWRLAESEPLSLLLSLSSRCLALSLRSRLTFSWSRHHLHLSVTDEREKQAPPKLGSIPGVDYELLLQKFKLFDHDVQRYGPTAGLTRRERLESAMARNQALDENALAVKHALESKIVDEENPTWKYSVWKNNPGLDVDF
jgi:hypothetical protein